MALVKKITTQPKGCTPQQVLIGSWTPVKSGDTCDFFEAPGHSDRTMQVEGTFGGATVTLQGSNDGTVYHTLTDPLGADLSFAASVTPKQVLQLTRYVKPVVAGGDGTTSLTITLLGRSE